MAKKATTKPEVKLTRAMQTAAKQLHQQDAAYMRDAAMRKGVGRAHMWAQFATTCGLDFSDDDTTLAFVKSAGFNTPSQRTLVKRTLMHPRVIKLAETERDKVFASARVELKSPDAAFWALTVAMVKAHAESGKYSISSTVAREACKLGTSRTGGAAKKQIKLADMKKKPATELVRWMKQNFAGFEGLDAVLDAVKKMAPPPAAARKGQQAVVPEGKKLVDADIASITQQIASGAVSPTVGARRLAALKKKSK